MTPINLDLCSPNKPGQQHHCLSFHPVSRKIHLLGQGEEGLGLTDGGWIGRGGWKAVERDMGQLQDILSFTEYVDSQQTCDS